jgi:aminoglycoside phosphotransferase (APT) family kinase protein
VRSDGSSLALVLRQDPLTLPRPDGMRREALAIEAAARAGVPEPRVLGWSSDPGVLGSPFLLMEKVEGETIARRILRDDRYKRARAILTRQCGEALARIHSIPVTDVPGLASGDPLAETFAVYESMGELHPALELGFRWLEQHRPASSGRQTVVHGDFRNGNFIVGLEGLRAVLDWEIVHLGDPMEDLGWLCVNAWRFGAALPVGGFGSYEELFSSYSRATGEPVDSVAVRWWEIFGTLRWGVGCMGQARRHLSGAVRSVELAALGRRVCEQEHDLLTLLSAAG